MTARTQLAALAAAALAVAGAVATASPAQAFTTRVETVNTPTGYGADETVTLPAPVSVTAGSTLRVARRPGYTQFTQLLLTDEEGFEHPLWTARPVRGTTTAWDVPLPGHPAGPVDPGTYRARLLATDDANLNRVAYVFTLVVRAGTPARVKVPLTGPVQRRITGAAGTGEWMLAGSRVTWVAPPGVSFRDATVRVGPPAGYNGEYIEAEVPGDLAVTRTSSGRSLQFRIPTETPPAGPILTRQGLNVEIAVPAAPTNHGTGRLVLQGAFSVDPAGTPWSAPSPVEGVSDHLAGGQSLPRGRSLVSRNGTYRLAMQRNSNLVLWKGSRSLWQTGQLGAGWTELNGDGNLVQRAASGAVVWQTARYGARGRALLVLQDDGNLVIRGAGDRVVWQTSTTGR